MIRFGRFDLNGQTMTLICRDYKSHFGKTQYKNQHCDKLKRQTKAKYSYDLNNYVCLCTLMKRNVYYNIVTLYMFIM